VSAQRPAGHPLLVIIDPTARVVDGESVRIAKDVLCAGSYSVKIALPETAEEADRAVAHRGRRRIVVIGDDGALLRALRALHHERALGEAPVGLVPVGPRSVVSLARSLGVPAEAVPAARAVLDGAERALDLLIDDSGGIVIGALRIPSRSAGPGAAVADEADDDDGQHWWTPVERTARSLVRTLTAPIPALPRLPGREGHPVRQRLRVEADGILLTDLDHAVHEVSVRTGIDGLAEVVVRRPDDEGPMRVRARSVTVSGRDFRYRADAAVSGPVRTRTWTVRQAAWRLTVPR
jgi:hypothetical protein